MKRLTLFNLAILLIIISALLGTKRVAHSEPQGERDQLVLKMLQAGSRGAGREVEAIASGLSRTTNIQPANQKSHTQARQSNDRGLAYVRVWDFQNATLEFDKAFAMNPADIEIANNLGFSLSKIGKHDEAKKRLLYTLALAPNRVNAWFNLGGVLALQGDTVAAAGAFYNAILFSPKKQITVASMQTDTEYGPPELAEAYRNAVQMAGLGPPDASPAKPSGNQIRKADNSNPPMGDDATMKGGSSLLRKIEDTVLGKDQRETRSIVIGIEAERLVAQYEANEIAADARYKDQMLAVTGIIGDFDKGPFGGLYVVLAAESMRAFFSGVRCSFDKKNEAELSRLSKGERITVTGRCDGRTLGTVYLRDCSLQKPGNMSAQSPNQPVSRSMSQEHSQGKEKNQNISQTSSPGNFQPLKSFIKRQGFSFEMSVNEGFELFEKSGVRIAIRDCGGDCCEGFIATEPIPEMELAKHLALIYMSLQNTLVKRAKPNVDPLMAPDRAPVLLSQVLGNLSQSNRTEFAFDHLNVRGQCDPLPEKDYEAGKRPLLIIKLWIP